MSSSLKEAAVDLGIVAPEKIVVLGRGSSNGVDTNRFDPAATTELSKTQLAHELSLPIGVPVIGYVGRLTPDKGLLDLAKVSAQLHSLGIDHKLLIVGSQEEQFGDPWLDAGLTTEQLPVETGFVEDPAPYFQVMSVLALPTKREGMPNVVLEAASSGVPVVTTLATGARDSVISGQTGYLVPVSDATAMAEKISVLLKDPDLRARMGTSGREFIKANFERLDVWKKNTEFYGNGLDDCTPDWQRARC